MKLQMPKWLKKPDAPSPDLEAQLQAAQSALDTAQSATQAAQDAFDAAGTPETEQALKSAQDAERAAALHVGRAERLLDAARKREAEADRQRKKARVAEIRPMVSHAGALQAAMPLVEREADLLRQVVEVRIERLQLRREMERLVAEAESLLGELGEPGHIDHRANYGDSPMLVAEVLEQHLQTVERADPRWAMLHDIIREMAPGRSTGSRMVPRSTATEAQA